jgi:hypothetical protein
LAAGGCSSLDIVNSRLGAIGDEQARTILLDALWAHGSTYRWVDHANLRAEVTWIEHRALGDAATDMVWLVDPWANKVRIERPAQRQVALANGASVRVFVDGKETADLAARGQAAGDVRLARELLPMPFSLTAAGLEFEYVGVRLGPAEARVWQRLLVTYRGAADFGLDNRTVVEVRQDTHRVDNVLIQWPELPFVGRPMRVEMVEWWDLEGLALSRVWRSVPIDETGKAAGRRGDPTYTVRVKSLALSRVWRFVPIDETGKAAGRRGDPTYTVRVKSLAFNAKVAAETFSRP